MDWALVTLAAVGIPALTAGALHRGALAAGLGSRVARTVAATTVGVWLAWVAASALLAGQDVYRQHPTENRFWIPVALLGSLALALAATRHPVVARILAEPGTTARLALAQTPRVAGVVFLILLAAGDLPASFAVPAALGDIAIGLAAPFVATRPTRTRLLWFNILGLLDLVAAVSLGFLAGEGPLRLLTDGPSTAPVGLLPLVLIPTTAVPLAIALHLVSLRRLSTVEELPDRAGKRAPSGLA